MYVMNATQFQCSLYSPYPAQEQPTVHFHWQCRHQQHRHFISCCFLIDRDSIWKLNCLCDSNCFDLNIIDLALKLYLLNYIQTNWVPGFQFEYNRTTKTVFKLRLHNQWSMDYFIYTFDIVQYFVYVLWSIEYQTQPLDWDAIIIMSHSLNFQFSKSSVTCMWTNTEHP